MSRIADALRRASEIVVARDGSDTAGLTDSPHAVDGSPLEQYAKEGDRLIRGPRNREDPRTTEFSSRKVSEPRQSSDIVARPGDAPERPAAAVQRIAESAAPRPYVQAMRVRIDPAFEGKLVGARDARADSAEQYGKLAKALQDIQTRSEWNGPGAVARGLKTLLVSSAVAGEGKTLTAVNLALTLSESARRRVLLIDTNLQHPSVHDVLGLPRTPGLGDILGSDAPRAVPFLMISPLLSVLPAGNCGDRLMEALASDRMRALLDEAAARFDWVILDGPAVHQMARPHVLARLSRAVLLVIASGSTAYPIVDRAMTEIGRGCVVGTVLNRVKPR